MSTYKGIQGFTNINTSSDPTADTGQVWYNTTTNILKATVETAQGWATTPALNSPRNYAATGGAGDATAGLAYGGWPSSSVLKTEEYDGSTWTAKPDLGVSLYRRGGFGTTTAAVCAAGTSPSTGISNACEEFNGSSWSNINTAPYSGNRTIGFGLEPAGAIAGGGTPGSSLSSHGQYDGSSWTSATSMPSAINYGCGFGIQTAAFIGGAQVGAPTPTGYEWDGSSWTTAGALPGNAGYNKGGSGILTAGMYTTEGPASYQNDLKYDGSSWTTGNSVPFSFASGYCSSQTQNNTLIAAGSNAANFDTGGVKTKTLTTS